MLALVFAEQRLDQSAEPQDLLQIGGRHEMQRMMRLTAGWLPADGASSLAPSGESCHGNVLALSTSCFA